MEDNDNNNSSNQFNNDDDQNRIVQKLLRTNNSSKRKQLFWYDIRNFPDSLLIEILVRLPVKSMFMLKSVCKHWQTLISDPSFCRFYHSILNSSAALSSRPFRILDKYTWVPNLKEFLNRLRAGIHSSSDFSVLFLSNWEERQGRRINDQFRVLDMSNGLILCCSWNSTPWVYHICDPLTGQWISLPIREHRSHGIGQGLITRVDENHMLTGYTVVRVDFLKSCSDYLKLEMFSSETRKWIRYKLPCEIPMELEEDDICPIHCYGALHWRVRDDRIDVMIAFDPYKDRNFVRLIPYPNDRDLKSEQRNLGMCQLCGECQGILRYFEVAEKYTKSYLFKMWAMKDYEKGEWCFEFKVRRSDVHSTDLKLNKWLKYGWFHPLSFHPLNPNVVYLTCMEPERVVSYDVLNRRLDFAYKPFDINDLISWESAIPFMVPTWPVLLSVASQPCLTEVHSKVKRKRRKQRWMVSW